MDVPEVPLAKYCSIPPIFYLLILQNEPVFQNKKQPTFITG